MASQMAKKELTQLKSQSSDQGESSESFAKLDQLMIKTTFQRALRSKRTVLSLCGLSGHAIGPTIFRGESNKNLQP